MSVHSIKTIQKIPISMAEAWDFFSSPANLTKITPATMRFNIISKHHGERMYPGQIIEYYVTPLLNIRWYWMTEITHVEEHKFFVDEQRYGPYSMWHHQHHFKEIAGGIEMTDLVHYKLPFGVLGELMHRLKVEKQLKEIFEYRRQQVESLFGAWK